MTFPSGLSPGHSISPKASLTMATWGFPVRSWSVKVRPATRGMSSTEK